MRIFKNPLAVMLIMFMAVQAFLIGKFNNPGEWFFSILITLPGILIGLSFHEFAHAITAYMLGDHTAKFQGRVTVNPAAHIDPIGLIALLFIGFGWGKPVEINPLNFKNRRRDELLVAISGVSMNLFLAILFAGILKLLYTYQYVFMNSELGSIVTEMIFAIISINIVLMIFNLLPIPPLDGFGIITEIFNLKNKPIYYQIYDKGFVILMVLLVFNITDKILVPAVNYVFSIILGMFF